MRKFALDKNYMILNKEHKLEINEELGTAFFYWESKIGRLFPAKQVMSELGYKRSAWNVLDYNNLLENVDCIKLTKKDNKELFFELTTLNVVQKNAKEILMLSESGVWKLVIASKKKIGIQTRHWLATQVLPSIREKGYYKSDELTSSPLRNLGKFTERTVQIESSKNVNSLISKTNDKDYSKYWNELHTMVTGLTAKEIKELYKSKESATEILRKYMPHLQATESCINDIYKSGIGLESIKDSGLHKTLPPAIDSLFKLGIKLENL